MNGDLFGPLVLIAGLVVASVVFWWLERRARKRRFAQMAASVQERRSRGE